MSHSNPLTPLDANAATLRRSSELKDLTTIQTVEDLRQKSTERATHKGRYLLLLSLNVIVREATQNLEIGTGEMPLWSRALAAPLEDPGSIPSTLTAAHTCLYPALGGLTPHTDRHVGRTPMHIKLK